MAIIHTTLTAPSVLLVNEMLGEFKQKTKMKEIKSTVLEQPIEYSDHQNYVLHVYYDDGRENKRWTTGGKSIK